MKCISLWQPWASLMVLGAKRIETRHWPIHYRGPLLIHAAKTESELYYSDFPDFAAALAPLKGKIPLGALLGIVDMVDCRPTESFTEAELGTEGAFGNYSSGRFGWVIANPKMFPEPIPFRGQQGLFDVDLEEAKAAFELEQARKIRVFDTGTQVADWEMRNCDRCWKSYANQPRQRKDGKGKCDLDYELSIACMGDGLISQNTANRIGFKFGANQYTWDCPEREETKPTTPRAPKQPKHTPGQMQLL